MTSGTTSRASHASGTGTTSTFSVLVILAVLGSVGASIPATADPVVPGFVVSEYVDGITLPYRLTFSPSGDLFVGSNESGLIKLLHVPPGGGAFNLYGNTTYDDPDAVLYDAAGAISGVPGSVLVGRGDLGGGTLSAVKPDQAVIHLEGAGPFINPEDMTFDTNGRLLMTDFGSTRVFAKVGAGPSSILFTQTTPVSIAVDQGNQIFTSASDGVIRVHAADGSLVNGSFVTGVGEAPLAFGHGPTWGTNLYAVKNSTGQLLRIAPDGSVAVVGSGFEDAVALAFGPDGALYASLYIGGRIVRVVRATPMTTGPWVVLCALALLGLGAVGIRGARSPRRAISTAA